MFDRPRDIVGDFLPWRGGTVMFDRLRDYVGNRLQKLTPC